MELPQRPNQLNPNPTAFAPSVGGVTAPEVSEIDFTGRIDQALTDLNQAAEAYESDNGRAAQTIETAKLEHLRLLGEANAAKQRLEDLEAKGTVLTQFNGNVSRVEGQLQKLVDLYTKKVYADILRNWYSHDVPMHAISSDRKQDLKLHKRVQDLRKFFQVGSFDAKATAQQITAKADVIGNKLIDLKDHIAKDSAK
jgi:hypothetical protein